MALSSFKPVRCSLADLVGNEAVQASCRARAYLTGERLETLERIARKKVDFYPAKVQKQLKGLLDRVGLQAVEPSSRPAPRGAPSASFAAATHASEAPLSGFGYYRVGENGKLFLMTKSEHYHTPLGHAFPGYELLVRARRLGIPNATHNNTRGRITRFLEEELVREANGLAPEDRAGLEAVLRSSDPQVMNRVLNLETGSLAVEAALKMVLARFYRPQPEGEEPPYAGRAPVILVMGSDEGDLLANYHGTTVLTQMLRGMWPEGYAALEKQGFFRAVPIRPNRIEDLEAAFRLYEKSPYKIAGFFHEIVMMNYGARRLTPDFLSRAYDLCRRHDVPTVVDEIQSCLWHADLFMFREYGLKPTMVALGKGFPGGEYPASRLLFSAAMDRLPLFGALVTNGQEEIASLAYLVTMRWARANRDVTRAIGDALEGRLRAWAAERSDVLAGIDGHRHLAAICFRDLVAAKAFSRKLNEAGLDASVQTYKAQCPPAVLLKIPLIMPMEGVDLILRRVRDALAG